MKGIFRKVLTVLLAVVLVVSLAKVGLQQLSYRKGDQDYAEAETLTGLPQTVTEKPLPKKEPAAPKPEAPAPEEEEEIDPEAELLAALEQMDLELLRQINSDVLGWILIPGTEVNYPIVQRGDNDYYLNHTWKNENSSVGAIFLDYRNAADFSDGNTLIYGHNMKNRSMFGSLKYYLNDGHWEEHPAVYLVTDAGVHRYDIYAAYEAAVDSVTYDLNFADDTAKTNFIHHGIRRSVMNTGIVPTAKDSIITLSTCTGVGYTTRWVVQAALITPDT